MRPLQKNLASGHSRVSKLEGLTELCTVEKVSQHSSDNWCLCHRRISTDDSTHIVLFTSSGRIIHQNLQSPITMAKTFLQWSDYSGGLCKSTDSGLSSSRFHFKKRSWMVLPTPSILRVYGPVPFVLLSKSQRADVTGGHYKRHKACKSRGPNICMSEGGKWIGVVTPQGRIQIIDIKTGKKALVDPKPTSQTPIEKIAFMGKSSNLLALDGDGYLIRYDLSQGMMDVRRH